jgi:hypothetical protein
MRQRVRKHSKSAIANWQMATKKEQVFLLEENLLWQKIREV